MVISIITPSFNRGYILPQCYESIKVQTCKNFEWIIIDDGSVDDTEQIVSGFIQENIIDIKYIKQKNGGKHRAHNIGVKAARGELMVCVDSDDSLSPNAIERVVFEWNSRQIDDIIGILALRGDLKEHKPICAMIPEGILHCTMSDLRDLYGFEGDTVLFFKTDVLKRNPFKEFKGEKFLTENNLYCDLDSIGEMLLLNEVLYYCEYLPDGLTSKYAKLLIDNPKGTADTYYKMSLVSKNVMTSFKYAIIAQAYKSLVDDTSELDFNKNKMMMAFAEIFVPLFKMKYFRNL